MSAAHGVAYTAVVKQDCPTCQLVAPVLGALADAGAALTVYTQDDPGFPADIAGVQDDSSLAESFRLGVEIVPTLIRHLSADGAGHEAERVIGWNRDEWRRLTGMNDLGESLPDNQPGCGSMSVMPGIHEKLRARHGEPGLASRQVTYDEWDDPVEQAYNRGWSDGLPVVPPTVDRVLRMLEGTRRTPSEVVGLVPPNLVECTVEKVAINAVMAGCRPAYLPVVLAALETALVREFTMHGLLCTTYFSGPMVIVNGPVTRAIGMNSGLNCLGPGNRANATIGRALQLVIRNVGGGRPGEIDRSVFGNPGKFSFCFAEDESDESWEPLHVARGCAPGSNAVTLFHADGVTGFVDQRARTADELARSMAMALIGVAHPKLCEYANAVLVLSPEHYAVFRDSGWDRRQIEAALHECTERPGSEVLQGAGGVAEGMSPAAVRERMPKFWRDHGLLVVRAGGDAGLFSAIIGGWIAGRKHDEVKPITREFSA